MAGGERGDDYGRWGERGMIMAGGERGGDYGRWGERGVIMAGVLFVYSEVEGRGRLVKVADQEKLVQLAEELGTSS